ncbi:MAG: hypothetical protein R2883_08860 [Caldisericia bacterium]
MDRSIFLMSNNWWKGSVLYKLLKAFWDYVNDSVSAKILNKIMKVWDGIVSGSVAVSWITGEELDWKPVATRRGFFGGIVYSLWCKFLGFLRMLFGRDSSFQKSFFVTLAKKVSEFAHESPFAAVGIFCAGFFGTFGVLKMTIIGGSKQEILVLVVCFIISVLIMFIRAPYK